MVLDLFVRKIQHELWTIKPALRWYVLCAIQNRKTVIFPVIALFCRKMTQKASLSMKTVHFQKKGKYEGGHFAKFWKQANAHGFKECFCHANVSKVTNVFVMPKKVKETLMAWLSWNTVTETKTFVRLEKFAWQNPL